MNKFRNWLFFAIYAGCLFIGHLEASQKVIQVEAGGFFGLILTSNDTVYSWGQGAYGQLGNATTGGVHNNKTLFPLLNGSRTDAANSPIPFPVANLPPNIQAVAAGKNHAFALDNKGDLWAWGKNYYGELGHGNRENSIVPQKVKLFRTVKKNGVETQEVVKVKKIVAGDSFSLAISTAGELYAWGNNNTGQCGIGDPSIKSLTIPTKIKTYQPTIGTNVLLPKVLYIAAGQDHGLAVLATGEVVAWGNNKKGQLGDFPIVTPYASSPIPVPLPPVVVKQIAAGNAFSMMLDVSGNLYTWGINKNGQLGQGFLSPFESTPAQVPSVIFDHIVAGGNFALGIDSGAQAWTWGRNNQAELARLPTSIPEDPTPGLVASFNQNIAQVGLGNNFAIILRSDHPTHAFAWGANGKGQIGNGKITKIKNFIAPQKVELPKLERKPLAPENVKGTVLQAVFANRLRQNITSPVFNISWKLNKSKFIAEYRIYELKPNLPFAQAQTLVKTLPKNPEFPISIPLDTLQLRVFLVVSVDVYGVESAPVAITSSRF